MAERLHHLKSAQQQAAKPDDLIWLSASAGTGKTQVLTARVFRLLMREDVRPENILCLTFTKAGASEMAARIQERLADWVQADDKHIQSDLFAIGQPDHMDPKTLGRARTLFAEVIDAPGGGIRIQTIHSFCQALLASFPIEAGLVPGFRPLEEREQATMRREALATMLAEAESDGRLAIIEHVQRLAIRMGEERATNFLYRCGNYLGMFDRLRGAIAPQMRHWLDLPLGDPGQWLLDHVGDEAVDGAGLRAIAGAYAAWGTKTGLEAADRIAAWLAAGAETRAATIDDLLKSFLTQKGELLAVFRKQLLEVEDLAVRLSESLTRIAQTPQHMRLADELAGALEAGADYARTYAHMKRARGVVDFDDLIARTVDLLYEGKLADWVRFKLDQTIDHILVDEAQDTNADQWAIANALTAELFEREPEEAEKIRTLFTVGDFKQAIFGFQGTSPLAYEAARTLFAKKAERIDRELKRLALDDNFRSAPPILTMVDAVFEDLGAAVMGLEDMPVRHRSARETVPGRVALWRPVIVEQEQGEEAGETSEEQAGGEEGWIDTPTRVFADKLAAQVKDWIRHGIDGRAVEPGDVMILVRKRSDLAALIVAKLFEAGVPVAGVDRLRLNAPLAVQDLLAAIRFVLQPHDDLNLASLLVSPLIGWSQDDLLRWGYRTSGVPLWRHLRGLDDVKERIMPLRDILAVADLSTPYHFLENLLSGRMQGRKKLLARLGNDARDPIEELLNAAIAFEQGNTPSLQQFLRWFDMGDVDIKREAGGKANEVRVMTVHGSKGLQAPIVVLADATVNPDNSPTGGVDLSVPVAEGDLPLKLPLFGIPAKQAFGRISEEMERQKREEREEHWRLFYVAMTRAEDMLFVGGALGPRAQGVPPETSWYAAVDRSMERLGHEWLDDATWGGVRLYAPPAPKKQGSAAKADVLPARLATTLPDWALRQAPEEARPPRPLAPSSLGQDDASDPPPSLAMQQATERGRLIHALFERLPDVPADMREAAASRWLERQAPHWPEADRGTMIASVLTVMNDPAHAALFGPDSLAEAPIAAVVDGIVIAGTADRLVIGDDEILVVDFKTGRKQPQSLADVPRAYLAQMAAYAAALGVIFKDKRVRASLLFTGGPTWLELDADALDEHKRGFIAAQQKHGA